MTTNNIILQDFLNTAWFNSGSVTITSKTGGYVDGLWTDAGSTTEVIDVRKVLVPMNARAIADRGLGEFSEGEVFSLFTEKPLRLSNGTELRKGDTIQYDGFIYKLMSQLNFTTHNFWKYTVVKYKETSLGDQP